jgi:O-antigen/teichoic acid export membrane protein
MIGHSALYLAVRAVNGLLALATLALLTRLLSPSDYGRYALGMATMTVLATVLFQWLNLALARFHAAHGQREDALLDTAHRLFFGIAAVLLAGVALWSGIGPDFPFAAILAIGIGAAALGLHNLHLQIANARGQPLRYGLITATRASIMLGLACLLVLAGAGATGALAAFAAGCVLAVSFFGARWRRAAASERAGIARQLVSFGLPLSLASLSTMVLDTTDRFLIALWHGSAAVAVYAAGYDLTQQTVGVALNVFFLAAYPRVTSAWESGGARAAQAALVPLQRGLLLAGPLAVALFAGFAPEIAALMFGAGIRADAATVMPWIALAIGIGCIKTYFLDVAFHLSKSVALLLRIAVAMAAVSVALNLALIPSLGFVGAAWSAVAAFTLGAALSWWFGRASGCYPQFGREALKAALACAAVVIAVRLVFPAEASSHEGGLAAGAALRFVAAVSAFAAVAWALDLSQLRTRLLRRQSPLLTPTP